MPATGINSCSLKSLFLIVLLKFTIIFIHDGTIVARLFSLGWLRRLLLGLLFAALFGSLALALAFALLLLLLCHEGLLQRSPP